MEKKSEAEATRSTADAGSKITRGKMGRRAFLKGALATAPLLIAGPTILTSRKSFAQDNFSNMGPSTETEPYLIPSVSGVKFISILTAGEPIDGYRMVGIPDGLGAFNSEWDKFTVMMNHEIPGTSGIVRKHGAKGAFVSRWTIDRRTLKVRKGQDFAQSPSDVLTWDAATHQYLQGTTVWQRFCSGDLAKPGAYYYKGLGTKERIYLNGEETSIVQNNLLMDQGRAWAWIATGKHSGEAIELPRLGRMSFENSVASPHPQEKTIVALLDDSLQSTAPTITTGAPSEVFFYIGRKGRHGHPIDDAGLTNGKLFGLTISVNGKAVTEESNDFGLGTAATGFIGEGRFALKELGDVTGLTAVQIEGLAIGGGVARLQRVEDGAWDPKRKNHFYFVTTASLTANCRLWHLRFDDIERPEKGGKIAILLHGDEGHGMLDNVTIDRRGRILMDEDPGNADRIAKIWLYDIETENFIQVAQHNPKFFDPTILNNSAFLTKDEESSGIINAEHILGEGWFLLDVQVHKANPDAELFEGGQLLAMYVDPRIGGGRDHDHDGDRDDDDHEDDDWQS